MFEFEKKLMLTENQYKCIREALGKNKELIIQKNHYFDTPDYAMSKKGVTYRIRFKNGVYEATIKNHMTTKKDCSIEETISRKEYFDMDEFLFMKLCYHGDLITERLILYKDSDFEIVLDRNTYLGITDYELEIEYAETYSEEANLLLKEIIELLKSNNLSLNIYDSICKSKSERFFDKKTKNF